MSKGQRAMAVAMIYPGGSGKGANPKNLGLSDELIRQARAVLEHAPSSAPNVLAGASLNDAYDEALKRKKADDSGEAELAALRERHPDLADKVVEGELGIAAALVEASERDAREAERKETTTRIVEDAVFNLPPTATI